MPRNTAPWPLWTRQASAPISPRRGPLRRPWEQKSGLGSTTMMGIYRGSKSRRKPKPGVLLTGGGEGRRRAGWGKGQPGLAVSPRVRRWLLQTVGTRSGRAARASARGCTGQFRKHLLFSGAGAGSHEPCLSKLRVCFCSFCQTKPIQLAATLKEARLARAVSTLDSLPGLPTSVCNRPHMPGDQTL